MDIPSVSFSDEKIDKLYKEHENCFIDMLKINEFGVEEYDDRWINNPDEVEHRSFFEAQYYSIRNVLVTLGLESEESLDDLERSYKVYYEMENRRLKRAEVSKGKSSSSMELEM